MHFHWKACLALASSIARLLLNHGFFHVLFCPKSWYGFGRPQTWVLNIYISVGTRCIGWIDDEHILTHEFSLEGMSRKQCGQATTQPWVFPCWLLSQGITWVWMTSNMGTKDIYLCWNKFYWVACI